MYPWHCSEYICHCNQYICIYHIVVNISVYIKLQWIYLYLLHCSQYICIYHAAVNISVSITQQWIYHTAVNISHWILPITLKWGLSKLGMRATKARSDGYQSLNIWPSTLWEKAIKFKAIKARAFLPNNIAGAVASDNNHGKKVAIKPYLRC